MVICVPVLIVYPILGLIWVLSSYISNVMGVILVYALWYSSTLSAASDGRQKTKPTIVKYVCERKSSVYICPDSGFVHYLHARVSVFD